MKEDPRNPTPSQARGPWDVVSSEDSEEIETSLTFDRMREIVDGRTDAVGVHGEDGRLYPYDIPETT